MSPPTLQAVLAAHADITTVPAPGFRAYSSGGSQMLVPLVVTAVLERTAVVHPLGRNEDRRVLRLDAVFVLPEAVHWQPRGRHELKEIQSRKRVRANLRRGQAGRAGGDGLEAGETAWRSSSTVPPVTRPPESLSEAPRALQLGFGLSDGRRILPE